MLTYGFLFGAFIVGAVVALAAAMEWIIDSLTNDNSNTEE